MYRVYARNFWKEENRKLKPDSRARKTTLAVVNTEEEARKIAQEYNRTHEPGRLSRKAEFTKE